VRLRVFAYGTTGKPTVKQSNIDGKRKKPTSTSCACHHAAARVFLHEPDSEPDSDDDELFLDFLLFFLLDLDFFESFFDLDFFFFGSSSDSESDESCLRFFFFFSFFFFPPFFFFFLRSSLDDESLSKSESSAPPMMASLPSSVRSEYLFLHIDVRCPVA
jgi:hypothetical protein